MCARQGSCHTVRGLSLSEVTISGPMRASGRPTAREAPEGVPSHYERRKRTGTTPPQWRYQRRRGSVRGAVAPAMRQELLDPSSGLRGQTGHHVFGVALRIPVLMLLESLATVRICAVQIGATHR